MLNSSLGLFSRAFASPQFDDEFDAYRQSNRTMSGARDPHMSEDRRENETSRYVFLSQPVHVHAIAVLTMTSQVR